MEMATATATATATAVAIQTQTMQTQATQMQTMQMQTTQMQATTATVTPIITGVMARQRPPHQRRLLKKPPSPTKPEQHRGQPSAKENQSPKNPRMSTGVLKRTRAGLKSNEP